ncbi:hypothetical protein GCM10023088_44420 [Actinomadura verrucosospora]
MGVDVAAHLARLALRVRAGDGQEGEQENEEDRNAGGTADGHGGTSAGGDVQWLSAE